MQVALPKTNDWLGSSGAIYGGVTCGEGFNTGSLSFIIRMSLNFCDMKACEAKERRRKRKPSQNELNIELTFCQCNK